jgi:hypothetical protein
VDVAGVEEQRGMPVRRGLEGVGQGVSCTGVPRTDLLDDRAVTVDGRPGVLQGRVPGLVEACAVQRVEERTLLGRKPDVGVRHGGQPLPRAGVAVRLRRGPGCEHEQAADSHGRQQFVAVGEVPVRSGSRDAEPAARLSQRESAHPPLGDQGNRRIDERGAQIAVVVPPILSAGGAAARH